MDRFRFFFHLICNFSAFCSCMCYLVCTGLHRHCPVLSSDLEYAFHRVPPKDATPADYNNEDLYMEMEKLYYTVSSCSKIYRSLFKSF